ncbi:MAG: hypothetical protein FH756_01500 [Firmicutes bacterium]|nr:hypothetical protein [Bacillota bacterium]
MDNYTSGRASKIDNLDTAVSSRQPNVLTSTQANRLDAAISTRAVPGDSPNPAYYTNTRGTKLDNLDTNVGSRASQTSLNTVDGNVDTLIARLTSGRATNLDLLDDINGDTEWLRSQFPIAAVDWASKSFQTSASDEAWATDHTHLNISGSGYLVSLLTSQVDYRITLDGVSYYISCDQSMPLFPVRFNTSLVVKSVDAPNHATSAWVVLD